MTLKIYALSSPPQGKVGVSLKEGLRKRSANPESNFFSYLKDLKSRSDTLAPTPVKRLKVRQKESRYEQIDTGYDSLSDRCLV